MTFTLAAWLHDLDPFAIYPVRWYGLSYLVGFFVGYLLVRRVATVGISSLKPEHVGDLIVTLAIGVIVGGRLGYCVFYRPELLVQFDGSVPFWGVLKLWEGGMASHGGILGGIAAAAYFSYKHNHDLPFLLDLFAFGAPLGLFFGRIANFINGELFGRAAPESLPWAVKFPQEMGDWSLDEWRERIYHTHEAASMALANHIDAQEPGPGEVVPEDLPRYVDRLIAWIQAGDDQVKALVEQMLTPRHPSQLYGAVAEGLVVFAVLLFIWRVPRKPGIVGSWFCITYALMRIIDEFFRRPDVHIQGQEFAALGITRGQWLSVFVFLLGVWGLWYAPRRAAGKMGGWRRAPVLAEG